METIRTFIASPVKIPAVMKERIRDIAHEADRAGWKVKWVDPDLLHLTYRFLGETDTTLVPKISGSLSRSLGERRKISAEISCFGLFGPARSPRVIWMGLDNTEAFSGIKVHVDEALSKLIPIQEERLFKPHLTIGRVRLSGDPGVLKSIITEQNSHQTVPIEIDRVIFYRSILQKRGPVYSPLETIILK